MPEKKQSDTKLSNGMGVTSLVLGICSIVFCWIPLLPVITGIIGTVLAIKQKRIFPNDIATGGLVTSIIGLVLSVLMLIFWVFWALIMATVISGSY